MGPTKHPKQCTSAALLLSTNHQAYKANHSPISFAEVKNMWCFTSTPLCAFMDYLQPSL